jgi:hypothetical protein
MSRREPQRCLTRRSDMADRRGASTGAIMRILGLLFGAILLLPGLCSLGFMVHILPDPSQLLGPLGLLWLVCFAISYGGIIMIRNALRGPP